jgi:hypothetical protein
MQMKRPLAALMIALGALVVLPPSARSQGASANAAAPTIDPEAVGALERMGAFLRSQKEFAVRAQTTTEEVLDSGQKVQLSGESQLQVRRPDHLRADITSDRKVRQIYFDGKTFTLYGPRNGYYAQAKAPGTLQDLVDVAEKKYGVELPLADLFYWGTPKSGLPDIISAIDVGPSTVDGVATEQYAFRQKDVDWQIWIEQGSHPLPRRLVITTKTESAQPSHMVELHWNLQPKLNESLFRFSPPPDARRIVFEERGTTLGQAD